MRNKLLLLIAHNCAIEHNDLSISTRLLLCCHILHILKLKNNSNTCKAI